jgi:hypothetical protein
MKGGVNVTSVSEVGYSIDPMGHFFYGISDQDRQAVVMHIPNEYALEWKTLTETRSEVSKMNVKMPAAQKEAVTFKDLPNQVLENILNVVAKDPSDLLNIRQVNKELAAYVKDHMGVPSPREIIWNHAVKAAQVIKNAETRFIQTTKENREDGDDWKVDTLYDTYDLDEEWAQLAGDDGAKKKSMWHVKWLDLDDPEVIKSIGNELGWANEGDDDFEEQVHQYITDVYIGSDYQRAYYSSERLFIEKLPIDKGGMINRYVGPRLFTYLDAQCGKTNPQLLHEIIKLFTGGKIDSRKTAAASESKILDSKRMIALIVLQARLQETRSIWLNLLTSDGLWGPMSNILKLWKKKLDIQKVQSEIDTVVNIVQDKLSTVSNSEWIMVDAGRVCIECEEKELKQMQSTLKGFKKQTP